jgi:hypothetical protein
MWQEALWTVNRRRDGLRKSTEISRHLVPESEFEQESTENSVHPHNEIRKVGVGDSCTQCSYGKKLIFVI